MQTKIRRQRGQRGVKLSCLIFSDSARSYPEKTTAYAWECVCVLVSMYVFTLEYVVSAFPFSMESILSYSFLNEH